MTNEEAEKHIGMLYNALETALNRLNAIESGWVATGHHKHRMRDIEDIGGLAGFEDAPKGELVYGRKNGKWVVIKDAARTTK